MTQHCSGDVSGGSITSAVARLLGLGSTQSESMTSAIETLASASEPANGPALGGSSRVECWNEPD